MYRTCTCVWNSLWNYVGEIKIPHPFLPPRPQQLISHAATAGAAAIENTHKPRGDINDAVELRAADALQR